MEQPWERSWEERKETNGKPSTYNQKRNTGNRVDWKRKRWKTQVEQQKRGSRCKAYTWIRGTEEAESQVAGSEMEANESEPKGNGKYRSESEDKHLWNSCGSETGKGEKKHTVEPSTENRKECMGNQAGNKVES